MLQFDQLSYWERSTLLEGIDFLVIGSGIVGSACALRLRERFPDAKIVILERGYLPTGASTKNAGFACFGSVTELDDDLEHISEERVWATVELRWRGLQRLQERFSAEQIGLVFPGSWDLLTTEDTVEQQRLNDRLGYFNEQVERITGQKDCYSYDDTIAHSCGFQGIAGGFHNRLEGELHTGKLFVATQQLLAAAGITILNGMEVLHCEVGTNDVTVTTTYGTLKAAHMAVTVNGFAGQFLSDERIVPARAQVLVTDPIPGWSLPGTFHYQKGYYYFRSVDNRLLLGGGRNLDFKGETSTELAVTDTIVHALEELARTKILPGKTIRTAYRWAGIMGVGTEKKPLIELTHPHVGMAVRMGGMGVAIGSLAGEELAELF